MAREQMEYDVVIVGAGPAGLACAIRLKQQAPQLRVCVLEKAAEVGAHTLSGAVIDPQPLFELLPEITAQSADAPIGISVRQDELWWLRNAQKAQRVPHRLLPASLRNDGCNIVRLGHLVKWLGQVAEGLEIDIFAGFSADRLLRRGQAVSGVSTGDMGRLADGSAGPQFQSGVDILARYTVLAEGCRGHLARQLELEFELRPTPQTYALGIKELWQVPQNQPGLVQHSLGWPLSAQTYGGGFVYHLEEQLVVVGLVVGLNYQDPSLSPFEEMQRFKTHPLIAQQLVAGTRLGYGARAIAAGGWPSLPRLTVPGALLIGDDAGFLNPARIKGTHSAISSGMLAAHGLIQALAAGRAHDEVKEYSQAFSQSPLARELKSQRNFKGYMRAGTYLGALLYGAEQHLTRGKVPWTFSAHAKGCAGDHQTLRPYQSDQAIQYPKPDGVLTFDRLSSVYLSNTQHAEQQPVHLLLGSRAIHTQINVQRYAAPETRYCPAGVYEMVTPADAASYLQINAQNCIHCKSCDIKDPMQNIRWVPPQGGEGPLYLGM